MIVSGDVVFEEVVALVEQYFSRWEAKKRSYTELNDPINAQTTTLHFVEMPNAVQTEIALLNLASLSRQNPDYFPIMVANQVLGGGGEARDDHPESALVQGAGLDAEPQEGRQGWQGGFGWWKAAEDRGLLLPAQKSVGRPLRGGRRQPVRHTIGIPTYRSPVERPSPLSSPRKSFLDRSPDRISADPGLTECKLHQAACVASDASLNTSFSPLSAHRARQQHRTSQQRRHHHHRPHPV